MSALLIILSDEVIHEERLSASRGSEYELVAIGCYAFPHRQVGDVNVQRLAADAVCHLDAERWGRINIVGFLREEAYRLLDEGMETLLWREIPLVAGYRCPEKCRTIHRIVAWHTFHACQLTADIIAQVFQFLHVLAPCQDIEMGTDRLQALWVSLVQILVNPFLVEACSQSVPISMSWHGAKTWKSWSTCATT